MPSGGNQAGNVSGIGSTPISSSGVSTPTTTTTTTTPDYSVSQDLIDAITKFSGGLLGEGENMDSNLAAILRQAQKTQGLSNQYLDIGSGAIEDPRFAGIRDKTLQEQSGQLNRRGFGGSSAAMNQLGRVQENLNLQELSSRDTALGLGAQLGSQSAGLFGEVLSGKTAGIESLSLIDQLKIAGIAAENAGAETEDSGGSGLLSGLFDTLGI